jgi:membrane-bound lytic murein transglycosylase D
MLIADCPPRKLLASRFPWTLSRGALRVAVLAAAGALGGCAAFAPQQKPAGPAVAAAASAPSATDAQPLPDTGAPPRPNMPLPRPHVRLALVPAPQDLLGRLRLGFTLPDPDDDTIDAQLAWYKAHPNYLNRVFNRAQRYLYYISAELKKRHMPVDLALLPVVESAYDPFAYSHGRASGLWQIIPSTGRRLHLKQDWWFDGRRDVVESTRAALDYLQSLHDEFDGDWLLAIAGYNSGAGNIERAIRHAERRGKPTTFWGIQPYLPPETRTYVPRLLAIRDLVADPDAYDVSLPDLPNEPYFSVVKTNSQIDMSLASQLAGIDIDDLYALNAGVNRWATDPNGPFRLLVPTDQAGVLTEKLADLGQRERVKWTRHKVRRGETLGQIARHYRTTPAVLRQINDLHGNLIRAGHYLMIPHALQSMHAYTQSVPERVARTLGRERRGERHTYVVRRGDSLWTISQRFGVSARKLASWNAMAPTDVLSVGRKLVVWTGNATLETASTDDAPSNRIRRVNYVVHRGDSLARIARRFRVTVHELTKWNGISAHDYLHPGQHLTMYVDVTEQST